VFTDVAHIRNRTTGRYSSWDTTGRNADYWVLAAGETRVLADIQGPGCITHIWMTQPNHYRECLLKITWDDAPHPSILCPLGDFFGLGHGLVNSYQSLFFTASTNQNNQFNRGCALNCYLPINRALHNFSSRSYITRSRSAGYGMPCVRARGGASSW
jgi:hypothetical protein